MTDIKRQGHATTNLASRIPKAKKIEQLMQLATIGKPIKILEIGCGSGGISYYFAHHDNLNCEVYAIDVNDNRSVTDGYEFTLVTDTTIPFPNEHFDLVITNHVIEHVGEQKEQLRHLSEIKRVLKMEASCYLAVPNRWMLTEPHYKLKFLSWWPHPWRSAYLRLMRKGQFYDCEPLEMRQLEGMLKTTGFLFENMSIEAAKTTFTIEKPGAFATKLLDKIPGALLEFFKPIIPTLIYKLTKEK